jgi:hypothetical protein
MSEKDRKHPFGVSLDDELADLLREEAQIRGMSVSRLVRDVLRAEFSIHESRIISGSTQEC